MKRLLLIGLAACAFALAPTLSASAMSVATPDALGVSDNAVIQVRGRPWTWRWSWMGPSRRPRTSLRVGPRSWPPLMVGGIIAITGDLSSISSERPLRWRPLLYPVAQAMSPSGTCGPVDDRNLPIWVNHASRQSGSCPILAALLIEVAAGILDCGAVGLSPRPQQV